MPINIILLTLSYALVMTSGSMVIYIGPILGEALAWNKSWSTLPITALVCGVALSSMPASFLMQKIGRRRGFTLASLVGTIGSLLAAYGIYLQSFTVFCASMLLIGCNIAFAQQYRFAAAECVLTHKISRAVSWILLGGIFGAFLGPQLADTAKNFILDVNYSGSFISLGIVNLVAAFILFFLDDINIHKNSAQKADKSTVDIFKSKQFRLAVLAGVTAYAVMTFIMSATSLSMHKIDHHSLESTRWVIQSHLIAMYLPSLFTGYFIAYFGLQKIMLVGTLILLSCVIFAVIDNNLMHYWLALVCLGVGWNFLLISGTTLLAKNFQDNNSFKAQAINDFTIFSIQGIASISAGSVLFWAGWQTLNLLCLPLILLMFVMIFRTKNI